jgi:hypothetical protein
MTLEVSRIPENADKKNTIFGDGRKQRWRGDYRVLMLCSIAAPFAGGDLLREEAEYRPEYARERI